MMSNAQSTPELSNFLSKCTKNAKMNHFQGLKSKPGITANVYVQLFGTVVTGSTSILFAKMNYFQDLKSIPRCLCVAL